MKPLVVTCHERKATVIINPTYISYAMKGSLASSGEEVVMIRMINHDKDSQAFVVKMTFKAFEEWWTNSMSK